MISVYVPQCGLDNSNKDNFYDTLISFIRKWGKKEILVKTVDLMIILEDMKTLRTNKEKMVMKIGIRRRKDCESLFSYEHDKKIYTLQEEGNSPTCLG